MIELFKEFHLGVLFVSSVSNQKIRVNKFLSTYGNYSRRHGDELIRNGLVFINHIKANLGMNVYENDRVYVKSGESLNEIKRDIKFVYLALNKPLGITCTACKNDKSNIIDFVNFHRRIFPIGRLDKNSHGLILLTNNGDIVNKILRSENNHEKEYIVRVNKKITHEFINKMSSGVRILNQKTKSCKIKKIDDLSFNIILTQGLNRQIRRMCEALDYRVTFLKRIRVLNIELGNLKVGEYRHIENNELSKLFSLINYSN